MSPDASLFSPAAGSIYLDSATYGLPPRPTVEALRRAVDTWQDGTAHWIEDWDRDGEVCRELFARLIHAGTREVALMPAVSVASGIVATAVPRGGEVLVVSGDFTSVIYPFLAAQERGLLRVREAPLEELADAIDERTSLVAFSLVQSSDGRRADLGAIVRRAGEHGARTYVDVSQCLGVLPVDVGAVDVGAVDGGAKIDYLACAGYKWLCCPRGVAFLYVRKELWNEPMSIAASWRGGDDPYGRYYGTPLALAPDAARFDVSLAWHAWVGARASLEVLCAIPEQERWEKAHGLACRLAERFALPRPGASIVSVPVADSAQAGEALREAGVKASVRAGMIRLAPHFYNSEEDVDRAAEILESHAGFFEKRPVSVPECPY